MVTLTSSQPPLRNEKAVKSPRLKAGPERLAQGASQTLACCGLPQLLITVGDYATFFQDLSLPKCTRSGWVICEALPLSCSDSMIASSWSLFTPCREGKEFRELFRVGKKEYRTQLPLKKASNLVGKIGPRFVDLGETSLGWLSLRKTETGTEERAFLCKCIWDTGEGQRPRCRGGTI